MSDVSSTSSTTYTGMSGAGGGDMIRLTGMATGLDVDGMVKKMMAAEQTKLDKIKQQQQLIQWKQDAYKDIIKDIKDLQSSFFNSTDPTNNLLSSSNYAGLDVIIPDESKTFISATAGVGAVKGEYKITFSGSQGDGNLAQAAGVRSSSSILASGSNAKNTTKLTDAGIPTGSYNFTITYDNGDGNVVSKPISFTGDTTISGLVSAINTATNNSVSASYSELTGKLTVQTSKTGAKTSLSISGNDATGDEMVLNKLNLGDGTSTVVDETTANYKIDPLDAKLYITPPDSTSTLYTNSSNNFILDGITYSLSSKSDSSFSVTQDTKAVHDKIKSFLDKYNDIVDKIQTKLSEKKNYDYPPLTDSQKSSMKDSDITAWNEKAQQGVLRNDDNMQNLLSQLRSAFVTPLTDSSNQKITGIYFGDHGDGAIGIDTSDDQAQGAKITIVDDSKLNDAIANHGADLLKLFTNVSKADQSTLAGKTQYFNESGIMQRFSDILNTNVGLIGSTFNDAVLTKYANVQDDYSVTGGSSGTNTLPDQIYYQQLLIKKMNDDMKTKQEKYYQQFSQLETAMEQLNNQQSALTSMLGG